LTELLPQLPFNRYGQSSHGRVVRRVLERILYVASNPIRRQKDERYQNDDRWCREPDAADQPQGQQGAIEVRKNLGNRSYCLAAAYF
jgi:hypothetical protein